MTSTARRLAGLLPCGSTRSAHQMQPRGAPRDQSNPAGAPDTFATTLRKVLTD